ncbi:MAG: hypothetical protein B6244_05125 [Candidatus Cloacimonetes bacterium 4572_55]|nr:MAG: hypothetical protein B6244_05125 [Candidatus Cloacimonetes bacterium 4572_55]
MKYLSIFFYFIIALPFYADGVILETAYQFSPPKYYPEGDVIKGVCYDIITELNERLRVDSIKIQPKNPKGPFRPLKRLLYDLKKGKIDMFVGLAKTADREQIYQFSTVPVYEVSSVFAKSKKDSFDFRGSISLKGKKISYLRGSKTGRELKKIDGIITQGVPKLTTALEKLGYGKVDLIFYHNMGLLFTAKKLGVLDRIDLTKTSYGIYYQYIAFNKQISSEIIEKIDEALFEMMEDGSLDRIVQDYLGASYKPVVPDSTHQAQSRE